MPGPTLGQGQSYPLPPESLKTINLELYEYLYMLHIRMFGPPGGTGDLDADNISTGGFNVHGSTSGHTAIVKGTAVANAAFTASLIEVTDASVVPRTGTEQDTMLDELKADLNTFITDTTTALTTVQTTLNSLLASLRTANSIST